MRKLKLKLFWLCFSRFHVYENNMKSESGHEKLQLGRFNWTSLIIIIVWNLKKCFEWKIFLCFETLMCSSDVFLWKNFQQVFLETASLRNWRTSIIYRMISKKKLNRQHEQGFQRGSKWRFLKHLNKHEKIPIRSFLPTHKFSLKMRRSNKFKKQEILDSLIDAFIIFCFYPLHNFVLHFKKIVLWKDSFKLFN